jgi:hypothetical protein
MFYQIYQRGQFVVHKRLLIFFQGIILPTCLSTLFTTITDYLYTKRRQGGRRAEFSGFLLRLSGLAAISRLRKVRAFQISHNVPAVCDVLPARIRALRSKDQGWQNVGGVWRENERSE